MVMKTSNVELTKIYYYDHDKRFQNMSVPPKTEEGRQNNYNNNLIVKNNIFGQKWVLELNEAKTDDPKKQRNKWRLCLYIFLFCVLCFAVSFGIFFSMEHKLIDLWTTKSTNKTNTTTNVNNNNQTTMSMQQIQFQPKMLYRRVAIENDNVELIPIVNNTNHNQTSIQKNNKLESGTFNFYGITFRTESPRGKPLCPNCTKDEICMKKFHPSKPECIKILNPNDITGCGGLCELNFEYCKNLDKKLDIFQCLPDRGPLRCPPEQFNCGTQCIDMKYRCDGRIHCHDMVDEKNCEECDLRTHFHCGKRTSCIANLKRCDLVGDCWDRSDELNCGYEEGQVINERPLPPTTRYPFYSILP